MASAAMDDDFQLVDFKTAQRMHELVDEDHDEEHSDSDSDNDGIVAVSDLNSLKKDVSKQLTELKLQKKKNNEEYLLLEKMKKELEKKLSTLDSLIKEHCDCIKSLKNESNEYSKMNESIKKEMLNLSELRKLTDIERNNLLGDRNKLNRQLEHFKKDCNQLDDILSKLSIVPEYINKSKDIITKLNSFYTQTGDMEKEIIRLKELREQQTQLIKQAKLDLETMRSDHVCDLFICCRVFVVICYLLLL